VEGLTATSAARIPRRTPAEVLFGAASVVVRGIEGDFAMLDRARPGVRVWTCDQAAVVLGVSRDLAVEVDTQECARRGVAAVRRASGGGTVVVGPGTVQYALVIPHVAGAEPPSLDAVRIACNRAVVRALARCGIADRIDEDASGDLRTGDRKIGGLALRRHREATLLHGTLLAEADLDLICAVLRHPAREPEWRRGRPHGAFLAKIGAFDTRSFARELELARGEQVKDGA
jgi:lipoate-protein ligase A